jgi:hypothetical protein
MSSILGHDVVLNYVAPTATDMAASCAFYEMIGFVRSFEMSDADGKRVLKQMQMGNLFLELFPMNPDGPKSAEGNHFGLIVT